MGPSGTRTGSRTLCVQAAPVDSMISSPPARSGTRSAQPKLASIRCPWRTDRRRYEASGVVSRLGQPDLLAVEQAGQGGPGLGTEPDPNALAPGLDHLEVARPGVQVPVPDQDVVAGVEGGGVGLDAPEPITVVLRKQGHVAQRWASQWHPSAAESGPGRSDRA